MVKKIFLFFIFFLSVFLFSKQTAFAIDNCSVSPNPYYVAPGATTTTLTITYTGITSGSKYNAFIYSPTQCSVGFGCEVDSVAASQNGQITITWNNLTPTSSSYQITLRDIANANSCMATFSTTSTPPVLDCSDVTNATCFAPTCPTTGYSYANKTCVTGGNNGQCCTPSTPGVSTCETTGGGTCINPADSCTNVGSNYEEDTTHGYTCGSHATDGKTKCCIKATVVKDCSSSSTCCKCATGSFLQNISLTSSNWVCTSASGNVAPQYLPACTSGLACSLTGEGCTTGNPDGGIIGGPGWTNPPDVCKPDASNAYVCNTAIGNIQTSAAGFVNSIMSLILSIVGGIAVILIIVSGYRMMISQGNPENIKNAKDQLTAAIIGLLFVIFALVFLSVIGVNILGLPGFK